jgi:hypothetical protein
MNGRLATFGPPDVQPTGVEVDVVPAKADKLAGS